MRNLLRISLIALVVNFLPAGNDFASAAGKTGPVYVIPVSGMIERGLVYVVRRAVADAVSRNASLILLDMDTPGGRLDAAEEIIGIIGNLDIRTCTYVNPSAISAGAIISMATDEIYMSPMSKIGDAMPIMMTPFGGAQEMSDGMEEKAVSYVAGLIRTTAQNKKHDPTLAEAMVRREIEYKVGDQVISGEGQLLTLTNLEAERIVEEAGKQRRLLSKGTFDDIGKLLDHMGLGDADVIRFEESGFERIARYIEMFSAVLLGLGLLLVYIEFKTPGFGLPGISGIILLMIWFWGHNIAGLAGMGEIIIFLAGVLLLALEIFVLPGFGFAGMTGISLVVLSVIMGMVQHYPGTPWYTPPVDQIRIAVVNTGLSIVGVVMAAWIIGRFFPETAFFRKLALSSELRRDNGFRADSDASPLVGQVGKAASALHPAGIAVFGDMRVNVVTRGEFVDSGTPVVVSEASGNRIVVEPAGTTDGKV